jgi:exoribonuclease II
MTDRQIIAEMREIIESLYEQGTFDSKKVAADTLDKLAAFGIYDGDFGLKSAILSDAREYWKEHSKPEDDSICPECGMLRGRSLGCNECDEHNEAMHIERDIDDVLEK